MSELAESIAGIERSDRNPLTVGDLRAFAADCDRAGIAATTTLEALTVNGMPGVSTGYDLTAIRTRPQP